MRMLVKWFNKDNKQVKVYSIDRPKTIAEEIRQTEEDNKRAQASGLNVIKITYNVILSKPPKQAMTESGIILYTVQWEVHNHTGWHTIKYCTFNKHKAIAKLQEIEDTPDRYAERLTSKRITLQEQYKLVKAWGYMEMYDYE